MGDSLVVNNGAYCPRKILFFLQHYVGGGGVKVWAYEKLWKTQGHVFTPIYGTSILVGWRVAKNEVEKFHTVFHHGGITPMENPATCSSKYGMPF